MRLVHESPSPERTDQIGRALGEILRPGDCLLIDGPLGAGKTTLIRAVAAGLGVDAGLVSSPTFVMVNHYPLPSGGELIHVDAYRLSGADDLASLGWDRIAEGPTAILAVEWPERLGAAAVPSWAGAPARITIHPTGESARELTLDLPEDWAGRPGFDALRPREATICRITGRPVPADSPTWPFADERARMADLYRWLSGSYAVGGGPAPEGHD